MNSRVKVVIIFIFYKTAELLVLPHFAGLLGSIDCSECFYKYHILFGLHIFLHVIDVKKPLCGKTTEDILGRTVCVRPIKKPRRTSLSLTKTKNTCYEQYL